MWGCASERWGPRTTAGRNGQGRARVRTLFCGSAVVFAITAIASGDAVAQNVGPAGGRTAIAASVDQVGEELVAKRTRTSRTYLSRDGRGHVARVFQSSVNYRDGSGDWRPIANALDLAGDSYRNRANRFVARLPKSLAGGEVSLTEAGDTVAFSLRDATATAQVAGAKATYRDAFSGVDVSYEVLSDAIKELIILKSASARREFVFDLSLSDGLSPSLEAGALAIRDASGELTMSVPAPFMTDANDRASHAVGFTLARVQEGWRLTLSARDAWLDGPERAYPVAIDPVVYPGAQADCKLKQDDPTTDFCAMSHLDVGGPTGGERRAALRFDVAAAVPDDAIVTYGHMKLWLNSQSSATQGNYINAHRLTRQIAAGATWNSPWTTPGGDFSSTVACTNCPFVGGSPTGGGEQPGGPVYWFMADLVAGWANGSITNDGVLLKVDQIRSAGNVLSFSSSEAVADQPYLAIRYQPRTGVLPAHKYESQQLTDRLSLAVNSSNGNLLLRSRDLTVPGGLGPDLTVSRTFNTLRPEQYAYGRGFSADFGPDVRLEVDHGDRVVYHGPSGLGALFKQTGATSYETPKGFDAKLEKTAGGWTYTENQSQRTLTFDATGRLTRDQDRNNRAITYTYAGSGSELSKLTDSQGRDTTFSYTGGRITQMTDPASRVYEYAYDGSGRLSSYTDPENGVTYLDWNAYGPELIRTPADRQIKITYHTSGAYEGRVASIIRVTNTNDPFASLIGHTTQFSYTINSDGSGQSVVTDPNAKQVTTVFDTDARPTRTTDGEGRVTSKAYTTNSNVQSFTVAGNTGTTPNSTLLYDADNNLTGAQTPTTDAATPDCSATSTTCIRSEAKYGESAGVASTVPGKQYLLTSTKNEQGRTRTLSYDANGNPKTIGSPLGTITLNYDTSSPGKLDSITDQRAKTTSYGYDASGNLTQVTPPMPMGSTTLTYTASLSRIATVTDGKSQTRTLSYDDLDRVEKITYGDASYVQFVYDNDGNLTARNDTVGGNSTYTHDTLSRVLTETLPGSLTNTYTYDPASNLKTLTDTGGTVTYGYDGANRNTSVAHATQNTILAYTDQQTANGPTATTTYPNGVIVVRTSDYAGRLQEIKATKATTTLEHLTYDYDDASTGQGVLRVRMVDVLAAKTTRYQYDDLDRLARARTYTTGTTAPALSSTCAADGRLACYEYDLDAAGNRTQRSVTGSSVTNSTTTYAYNDANQLTTRTAASNVSSYNYDANGNHTTRTGTDPRTLAYNLRGQTTNLAGTTIGYLGAGQDQPVSEGATTLQHNILGLGRRTTSGTASYYTRTVDGSPLAQRTGSDREYYIQDALGSTLRTTDTTGATQATYNYDPDGAAVSSTGTSTNPLKYAAGYHTTTGLYHYGQRYYDPTDARWTQPDPLDQATDLRQANKYTYVGGDPINNTDPTGCGLFGKYTRIFCLARCAGECGSRAYTCIYQVVPQRILLCFAIRCGPKGVKCVRDCF